MEVWIGIDVSKDQLDVCVITKPGKPKKRTFKNAPSDFPKLVRYVKSLSQGPAHYCMESTGRFSQDIAHFLVEAGEKVSVENPARIHYYGLGIGVLNKDDPIDAFVIADYCRAVHPAVWRMAQPEVRALSALMRRLQSLKELRQAEENRMSEPGLLPAVRTSLEKSIAFLSEQIEALSNQIQDHINTHPGLRADHELLTSIPGIGELTAQWILAELPDVRQFQSAQAAAAFAGLSPRRHQSGTSVRLKTRLSKAGNTRLRSALYFPAVAAATHNPVIRALYLRLQERGLCRMAALGACMRKLIMIAYGVLRTRTKFKTEPQTALA